MSFYTDNMKQEATYFAPGANNGLGQLDFSGVTPVLIKCRWQNDAVLFRDTQGQQVTSSAIVYPDQAVSVGGYLVQGDETGAGPLDPRGIAGAYEIRQVASSPSLDGTVSLIKAFL